MSNQYHPDRDLIDHESECQRNDKFILSVRTNIIIVFVQVTTLPAHQSKNDFPLPLVCI